MGKKSLAVGAALLLVVLVFLWREMNAPEPAPVAAAPREPAPAESAVPKSSSAVLAAATPVVPAPAVAAATAETKKPWPEGKLDPRTDEFFYKFDEQVPKIVTKNAAKCYEGRQGKLHRNQKLSLTYKVKVVDGSVTVTDVAIKENTINDPALEACFIQQVRGSTWKDDELPDVEVEDMIVLRPERGMKKFWQSNVDYVGEEVPRVW